MGLSLDELSGWQAYASLQPFGFPRDEYFNARICATIRNTSGRVLKEGTNDEIDDWLSYTKAMREYGKPGTSKMDTAHKLMNLLGHSDGR